MRRALVLGLMILGLATTASAQWSGAWDTGWSAADDSAAIAVGIAAIRAATGTFTATQSFGNAATSGGEIRLLEDTDNGANYMGIKAPDAVTASKTLTLPDGWPSTTGSTLNVSDAGVISYVAPLTGSQNTFSDVQTFSKPPDLPAHQDIAQTSTTVTIDFAVSHNAIVAMDGSNAISTLTVNNLTDSDSCTILFVQGGTAKTVDFPDAWLFSGGTEPTVTASASAKDLCVLKYIDGTVYADCLLDVK